MTIEQVVEPGASTAHDDLARAVDVGDPDVAEPLENPSCVLVAAHHRDHGALARCGGARHRRTAHGDEPRALVEAEQTGGDERRELPETVAEQVARTSPEIEQFVVADQGEREGSQLRLVGAHDFLLASRREERGDVEVGGVAHVLHQFPVTRVGPTESSADRDRSLAGKERDDVVAKPLVETVRHALKVTVRTGARSGTRTHTPFRVKAFEASASANSAIRARRPR